MHRLSMYYAWHAAQMPQGGDRACKGSSFARGTCIQSSASADIVHGDKSLFGHFFSCKQNYKHDYCHLTKYIAHIITSAMPLQVLYENCSGVITCCRSTAQHSTAQHSTAQHSTAQHSTAWYTLSTLQQQTQDVKA